MNLSRLFFIKSSKTIKKFAPVDIVRNLCATVNNSSPNIEERNPTPIYFSNEVQSLLKSITGRDLDKICNARKEQKRLKAPTYQFMTTEELEEAINSAKQKVDEKLQIPPVMLARKPIEDILAKDTALKGFTENNFVFTDITFGKTDRNRWMLVRTPDGTLRKASWEERDRLNHSYFPVPGRSWKVPKMFENEYLEPLLEQNEYEFILDRACLQFEPDNQMYIDITHKVYDHVNQSKLFHLLRSTRHFGPLAFYLAWNKNMDNLIIDCLAKERLEDAVKCVKLLYIIHPSLKTENSDKLRNYDLIKEYSTTFSKKQGAIELAVQNLIEKETMQQELTAKLQKAHGSNK